MDNKKKKEDRLRKNPPPIPYKVQLMMRAKGFGSKPIDWRQEDLKPFPVDDAWTEWFHSWKRLSVEEVRWYFFIFSKYKSRYYKLIL